jgi:plasmid maintenance system antidote protein VapI
MEINDIIGEKVNITYEVGHKIASARGTLESIKDCWVVVKRNNNLTTAINILKVISIRKVKGGFNNVTNQF